MSLLSFFLAPTPERSRRLLVTAALVGVAFIVYSARAVLMPFIIGLALAYLLLPPVRFFERHMPFRHGHPNKARLVAVVVVYLLLISSLIVVGYSVFPMLAGQIARFIDLTPTMFSQARDVLERWTVEFQTMLSPELRQQIESAEAQLAQTLVAAGQDALLRSVLLLTQTFSVLLGLATIPVWLFYVLKDQQRGKAFIYGLFPPGARADVAALAGIVDKTVAAYMRAQLLLGFMVGSTIGIGLAILQVPFALVLGIIAGVTEMIPVLGPILGSVAALVVVLASTPDKFLVVLILCIAVQQLENNLLVPRIQGDALEIHPAFVMVLLVMASEIAGILGMLLVVPAAAVCRDVFLYLYRRQGASGEAGSAS
ncbi:MAG: AI-2E family transporter [Dehalococcoidia bacterium]|nr:AI-2E family transporter [Dehalococcoidia bacterium]